MEGCPLIISNQLLLPSQLTKSESLIQAVSQCVAFAGPLVQKKWPWAPLSYQQRAISAAPDSVAFTRKL
ncbi:unnamed protein product [Prunus armeniaca]|uniref:Uncharacterized protein n=1 Tax=Prunus armeniaca TaxID=36596 RepID=A0A6J5TJV2_PRUAR|nr:unnamed protein product [Prunus armeniaca]